MYFEKVNPLRCIAPFVIPIHQYKKVYKKYKKVTLSMLNLKFVTKKRF